MSSSENPTSYPYQFDGMDLPPYYPLMNEPEIRLQAIRELETREDDILLVTYPKSGTHWTFEVINMLQIGKAEYSKETRETTFLEALQDLAVIDELKSPRILNTHLPTRWIPRKHVNNSGEIVHVMRNPKDIFVSWFHHLNTTRESLTPWSEMFDVVHRTVSKQMGGWTAYVKEFEKAGNDGTKGTIHTTHYEDLKQNPLDEIRKLTKYLQVPFDDTLLSEIADKCSFRKLKAADKSIKSQSALRDMANYMEKCVVKPPVMYRKGIVGDWKSHFTVAQSEMFDAFYHDEMKDLKIRMKFEL